MSGLTELDHTAVTDAGLVHLKGMTKLRWLELGYNAIADAGLKNMGRLANLRTLDLFKTEVTRTGFEALCKALPETRIIGD